MVHKKYTYKDGKKFGPYYYETKRVNGKIVTTYLGTTAPKNNGRKNIFNLIAILGFSFVLLSLYFVSFSLTGNATLDIKTNYNFGESISGKLTLNLLEGELIPADSMVLVSYGNFTKEVKLSDLISDELVEGDFYAEGVNLNGKGLGYGFIGAKEEYPFINFKLNIIEEETSQGNVEVNPEITPDENKLDEEVDSEIVEDSPSENQEPQEEAPQEESVDNSGSESSNEESSPITGGVVSSQDIDGRASKDESFTYSLSDGEDVELVSGSVYYKDIKLEDNVVSLKVKNNEVTVSTDYSIEQKGFGEGFLGKNSKKISFDLDNFELIADEEASLVISLIYGNQEIVSVSEEIIIKQTKKENEIEETGEQPDVVKLPELNDSLNNQSSMDNNFTEFNQTISNFTELNKTQINESIVQVEVVQFSAKIGEPVRWVKKVSLEDVNDSLSLVVEIPASAENITVEKIRTEEIKEEVD